KLVEQGVLVKVPYNERPLRHEYRLTRKGLGLYPVLMSLARWGDDWMTGEEGVPLQYVHRSCGKVTRPLLACSECGEPLRPEGVMPQPGPSLQSIADDLAKEGRRDVPIPELIGRSRPQE
ncbi:MAG TPA: transcriptional regulator, partial [Halieaceae bacterium]|nr:transcriptional regulator [Halieaceae bacterium]